MLRKQGKLIDKTENCFYWGNGVRLSYIDGIFYVSRTNGGSSSAYTGAVKDDVIDTETLACHLMKMLWKKYPDALRTRYKIDMPEDAEGYELLTEAGRKRGFLLARGEIDTERMAKILLEEYRNCKIGRFTLEDPPHAL